MRIATFSLAALALLVGVAPSLADQAATQPASRDPGREIVCKLAKPETGSLSRLRRICLAKDDWDAARQDGRDTVEQAQAHSLRANDGH